MRFLLKNNHVEFLPDEKPIIKTEPVEKILKIVKSGIKANEIRPIDPLQAYANFFGIINQTLEMLLDGSLEKDASSYLSNTWVTAWNTIAKKV